ncbi:MAG: DegV family protein [Lachnospiraceae bacterium]|nr:DegV family protein [Lachnospiraceae bacterium]
MKFITDSSCDIDDINGTKLEVAPLTISTKEREFLDDKNLDVHEMLDYLRDFSGQSHTACPSPDSWLKTFENGTENYVVTMTSKLSGTYNSAKIAKDMYQEDHPDSKICIIDSLSTGPEMRLIMEKIIELKNAGKTFEEISSSIKNYLAKTRLFFAFKSLHNFAQNGRINKAIAAIVEKLNIRIIGTASDEGDIMPTHKCRGEKSSLNNIVSEIIDSGFNGGKIRICHVENLDFAKKVGERILELFPKTDLKIYPARGICSYYGERGGIIIGCED